MITGVVQSCTYMTCIYMYLLVDILDVSPRGGSKAGGTKISVTLNMPLSDDDLDMLVVNVGGEWALGWWCVGGYVM